MCDGNLLLAADVYYKEWEDAPLWEDVFVNQWAFAFGAQLTRGKLKYRLGYSYNTNPVNHSVGDRLDGFPVAQADVQLFQATSAAFDQPTPHYRRHRSAGFHRPEPGLGPVRRWAFQRPRRVRGLADLAGHVLRGRGADLEIWRRNDYCFA